MFACTWYKDDNDDKLTVVTLAVFLFFLLFIYLALNIVIWAAMCCMPTLLSQTQSLPLSISFHHCPVFQAIANVN